MGISFSKQVAPSKLVEIAVNIPQLVDDLDPADVCALARVNRDLKAAVDHPAVWRGQFAKTIGVAPRALPDPGDHLPFARNPFKLLSQGISTARYVASQGQQPTDPQTFMMGATYGYLREHFPDTMVALTEVLARLRQLEADGELPEDFWDDMAFYGGATAANASVAAINTYAILKVPATVAVPTTKSMAVLVKLLGTKGAKIYLYTVLGTTLAGSLLGVGVGVMITADTIKMAKHHHQSRQREMRDLRIKDLVEAKRAINQ